MLMVFSIALLSSSFANAQYVPSSQIALPEGAIARLGKGDIHDLTYSPDGSQVAATTLGGVWIYDVTSGKELKLLTGQHEGKVINATYSPDGKTLATVGYDKTVRLWDVQSGKNTNILKGHTDIVITLTYSPDGNILATGDIENTLRLWNPHTGKNIKTFKKDTMDFYTIGFSSDGNTIVSAGTDGPVQFWDVNESKLIRTLKQYGTPIAFSPKDDTVVVTANNKERMENNDGSIHIVDVVDDNLDIVYILDIATGQPIKTLYTQYHVNAIDYSADGKIIATVGSGGVQLWSSTTGELRRTLFNKKEGIHCIAFSPDSRTVATGNTEGMLQWWDVDSGKNIKTITGHTSFSGPSFRGSIKYSTNGTTIAIVDSREIILWDANTGEYLRRLKRHDRFLTGLSFSPDERTIASSSIDGTVRLWETDTGHLIKVLVKYTDSIEQPVYSPDGRTIVARSFRSPTDMLWLWNANTGENIITLKGGRSFAFSPDSRLLATTLKNRSIKVFDTKTGQNVKSFDGFGYGMLFSPDGTKLTTYGLNSAHLWDTFTGELINRIVSPHAFMTQVIHLKEKPFAITCYADRTSSLWDVTAGEQISRYKMPDNVLSSLYKLVNPENATAFNFEIVCSPSGSTFATILKDKPVQLWNVVTGKLIGKPIKRLKDEGGFIDLIYSPDGKTLATISIDGTVRLWDTSTGKHLKTLKGYSIVERFFTAFSPDSKTIATGHDDGTVLLWDIPSR